MVSDRAHIPLAANWSAAIKGFVYHARRSGIAVLLRDLLFTSTGPTFSPCLVAHTRAGTSWRRSCERRRAVSSMVACPAQADTDRAQEEILQRGAQTAPIARGIHLLTQRLQ